MKKTNAFQKGKKNVEEKSKIEKKRIFTKKKFQEQTFFS